MYIGESKYFTIRRPPWQSPGSWDNETHELFVFPYIGSALVSVDQAAEPKTSTFVTGYIKSRRNGHRLWVIIKPAN